MKIIGLKVLIDKGWKSDSTFTADDGRTLQIAANHKYVCQDDVGDIVNLTITTPAPLSYKVGQSLGEVVLSGNVSHSQFGWTVKASVASKV